MKKSIQSEGHSTAKAITGFLIVVIAFEILSLFTANKDSIIGSNMFSGFVFFTALGMVFLVLLLYLVDKPLWNNHKTVHKTSHKKKR